MTTRSPIGPARWRDWVSALFLFAVLLRGLVPAGWMPADIAGGMQLTICSADAIATAPAELLFPGTDQVPPPGADHSPCAFAGLGVPLLAAGIAGLPGHGPLILAGWALHGLSAAVEDSRRRVWPPAQAPPASV